MDDDFYGVYGWDGTEWEIINEANKNAAEYIAPTQGFFIAAKSAGNIVFTLQMQNPLKSTDDFISGRADNNLLICNQNK